MACFIIIMLWVKDELSYDKYNVNADQDLQDELFTRLNGNEGTSSYCPAPLAGHLKRDYPEVENAVRFRNNDKAIVKYNNTSYAEYNIVYADSTLFGCIYNPG